MGLGAGGRDHLLLTLATALMLFMRPPGYWGARIIGGHEVTPHSRPYMGSVSFEGQHHCGSAPAGWSQLPTASTTAEQLCHPGSCSGVAGAAAEERRALKAGAQCQVAGWGSVSNFEELPPGLMEAEVRVLGLDVCNSSWKGLLSPAMLCTHSGDCRRRRR
ncbi:serine protease 57 [Rhinolophus ferrumequinum]|uniref:Serine protease 57 n=1 Tax=Rhinolophus ferrumequinum TaxID=59479 RepID=A0A7J7U2B4_RHIFE|nr:serine protease 57 [Rhinolophus ferrumequinum]